MKGPIARLVLDFPESSGLSRVRNLGEDLWRTFRGDRLVSIKLDEVDRATTQLTIDLLYASKGRLKEVRRLVDEVVGRNLMSHEAQITLVDLTCDV